MWKFLEVSDDTMKSETSLLRHQIKKLVKDEELRLRVARARYEKIMKFSWSPLTDRLERIFKELVKLN